MLLHIRACAIKLSFIREVIRLAKQKKGRESNSNPNPNPNPNPSPNPKPKPKPKPKPNPNSNPDQERDNPGSAKPKADAFSGSLDSASTACILSGKSSQTLVEGAADGVVAGEPPKKGGRTSKGVFDEAGAGSR